MKTLEGYLKYREMPDVPRPYLQNGDEITIELARHLVNGDAQFMEDYEAWDDGVMQGKILTDVVGSEGIYETVYRKERYKPFVYKGQCVPGSMRNLNPELSKRIYVCSRYRDKDPQQVQRNVERAKWLCGKIILRGDIPICPHIYFTNFLNEQVEWEREFGLRAGVMALEECDGMVALIMDGIISEGMGHEMAYAANTLGIPIEIIYKQSSEER